MITPADSNASARPDAPTHAPARDGDGEEEPPSRLPGQLRVDVVVQDGDWSAFEPLQATVDRAARAVAGQPAVARHLPAAATVAFATDAAVRTLNHRYRGLDRPTNVLSFPAATGSTADAAAAYLGDIVLADATMLREARELGIPPPHHLTHLVVHGLLHLLGYDHETDAEAAAMETLETTILAALGVADPYGGERS